jgi:hypothetical protein
MCIVYIILFIQTKTRSTCVIVMKTSVKLKYSPAIIIHVILLPVSE